MDHHQANIYEKLKNAVHMVQKISILWDSIYIH